MVWILLAFNKFVNHSTIWERRSHIEEANSLLPAFGRIFKEMIIVTDPARPLPRTPKNTVMRSRALALYEEDIDTL